MIALELVDVKDFMNKLLRTEVFDHFLLQEATIINGASFVIDGHIKKELYTESELDEMGLTGYSAFPFSMVRTQCFDLMKGKRTPAYFKIVFSLSPENLANTLRQLNSSYKPEDLSGIFVNIKYQNQLLTLTTGVSYRIFSTDKDLDFQWDELVKKFLKKQEIPFEEL